MRGTLIALAAFAAGLAVGLALRDEEPPRAPPPRAVAAKEQPAPSVVEPGKPKRAEDRSLIRIEPQVVVAGSGPPERARILVVNWHVGGSHSTSLPWTPARPWIELSPGTYEIVAELENEARHRSSPVTVTAKANGEPLRPRLEIRRRPALRLRVERAPLLRGAPLQVWILKVAGSRSPSPMELAASAQGRFGNDLRDTFFFNDLEPGRYAVGAAYGGATYHPQVTSSVDVVEGVAETVIGLPEPPSDQLLHTRLLDPEGNPIARVYWTVKQGGAGASQVVSIRRTDGEHLVPLPRRNAAGTVVATTKRWGDVAAKFEPGGPRPVELRYAPTVEVDGVVRGFAGSGYEEIIRYRWEERDAEAAVVFDEVAGRIEANGVMRMRPLQEGERILALYVATSADFATRIATRSFALRPGRQTVSIDLPRLHDLRVIWQGEGRPELSLLKRPDNEEIAMWTAEVGKDGVALFRALLPGEYTMSLPDETQVEIGIPERSEIRLPK